FGTAPATLAQVEGGYTIAETPVATPPEGTSDGDPVFTVVEAGHNDSTGQSRHKLAGKMVKRADGTWSIQWETAALPGTPKLVERGAWFNYAGATLTAKAFDRGGDGLGKWLVTLACWLFAFSTMISWSYYGEQGVVFLFRGRGVLIYRLLYCALVVVACIPWLVKTDAELDALTALGTGVMLWANIPIMLIFGAVAMKAYHAYFRKLKHGDFEGHGRHD
ncbi:MAG: alanine:cation symporter family protein, partial [Acidimicrobiales bacterium]